MKLKIYSLAITIALSLAAVNLTLAQAIERAPAVAPVPAVPPVAPDAETGVYVAQHQSQDTGYTNKLRKLQAQMRALSKEMSDLNREQSQKLTAIARERVAELRKADALRFDTDLARNLNRTFSSITRLNANADADLQKQVASGDVKEKGKTFSKSYPVDAGDKLQIDNRYGKITVNTWAKNEVKVDVDIKAYSLNDEAVQKLLDEVSIEADKSGNNVSFATKIQQNSGSWWGSISNNGKLDRLRKVTIDYVVYMPAKNSLVINNRYGLVTLPSLEGKVTINNSYGGLVAKALTNSDNNITVRYGDADIDKLGGSDVNVAYGSLALESADKLNANISYSTVKIGKLATSGDINIRYGNGVVVNELGKHLKGLTINSSYAPVKIGSTDDANADFDVTVHYAPFLHSNSAKITSQTPDKERGFTSTKSYKGQLGKGSSDNVIKINARYGSGVKFD